MQNCLTGEEKENNDFLTDVSNYLIGKTDPNTPERRLKCIFLSLNDNLNPDSSMSLNKLYSLVVPLEDNEKELIFYAKNELQYYYILVLYFIFGFSFLIYFFYSVFFGFNIFYLALVFIFMITSVFIFKNEIPLLKLPKIKIDSDLLSQRLENNLSKLGKC